VIHVKKRQEKGKVPIQFDAIRIGLASPETIRNWSYGEVTKPETINYRSFKPEKDGLFCERIFGPQKDWECHCGKYKRIRYRGVICDRCGVEVTLSKVRRERLGHIQLAVPVSHIWYFKATPSRIGYLLDLSIRNLERVLYYESYIVIDPGETPLKYKEILSEDQYTKTEEEYGEDAFRADMGAPAIKELLQQIEIEDLSTELRAQIKLETSVQRKKDKLKRLRVIEAFRQSGNKPEWMIMDAIPVIPPDLRPLVPLEGGQFATSDLNDLYRRVINRNNRLKKLLEIKAPEVILRNEKRMLQEAVDALFDNGRRSRAVRGEGNRPLKSLSDLLKGKQGRFRQNLLGKRVDYSGRSVIVVGPSLKMHQAGLPKTMALELFKPFIIKRLEDEHYVQTVKRAKRLVERETPEVWDILEDIIKDHPIFLNRAPTLHRLGIQAFEPILIEGKAITIHPLVCQAFNADFDGDQMAVHIPLSFEAQLEAKTLMLSINNILSPAHGKPLATPTHDIVLGCYYITKTRPGEKGEGKIFASMDDVIMALDFKEIDIHATIKFRYNGEFIESCAGRVLFNQIVPEEFRFINEVLTQKKLEEIVAIIHREMGNYSTSQFLDKLKDLGFHYATLSGVTVGIDDMIVPKEKFDLIDDAQKVVDNYQSQYAKGIITDGERYNKVIDTWTRTTSDVAEKLFEYLEYDRYGFNPIYMMADSGSRGNKDQIKQLAGMRGLMSKPQKRLTGQIGEIIETPITSNFREGLSVLEYFISTHGARKGLADTALKTADAGYLTRRLVDVAQDVLITIDDCGTIRGLSIQALKEGEDVIESLGDRIRGRVAVEDVIDPITEEVIVHSGNEIDEEAAERIENSSISEVLIRSVLTCEAKRGVCIKCYGRNLATGKITQIGDAVGVIAAQSIGEPGTQLTLRTFHIGGTAARIVTQSNIISRYHGFVRFDNVNLVENKDKQKIAISRNGKIRIEDKDTNVLATYEVQYGSVVKIDEGQEVQDDTELFESDPYSTPILTHIPGKVSFYNIIEGVTLTEKHDKVTKMRQRVIIEDQERKVHPRIQIKDAKGNVKKDIHIPTGAYVLVNDEIDVDAGTILVKIPKEIGQTSDITGGLPRVTELFEARNPKESAVVTEIEGHVEFGEISSGMRKYRVINPSGEVKEYSIPLGKHLTVHEDDWVNAGDSLSEGAVNPHDILRIKGANEVQEYLLNQIQEVYRLQGVKINDKHIEIIVRQMLQKVSIEDPGDSPYLEGDQVDRVEIREVNEKLSAAGGEPATFRPILLGITKASLNTNSFISAASFQETTRVLTEAAIQGKIDYLLGLKENVIMGHLIPAGTGWYRYQNLRLRDRGYEMPEEEEEEGKEEEKQPEFTGEGQVSKDMIFGSPEEGDEDLLIKDFEYVESSEDEGKAQSGDNTSEKASVGEEKKQDNS
jgi:DNA-directed RNA polymerase subunit beta'